MSGKQEFKTIELNWKIENFSYRREEDLLSPAFGSNSPDWELILSNTNNDISLSVRNLTCSAKKFSSCLVAFPYSDGAPLIWKERKIDPKWTRHIEFKWFFIAADVLNSNKAKFLPNGTLTIQCRLWQTQTGITTPVSHFARTEIEPPVKKLFIWEVAGVSSLQPPNSFERSETISDGELITMKLFVDKDGAFKVITTTSFIEIHAKIKIAVLNASGKKIEFENCNNQFRRRGEKWHFFTNVTKTMLMCYPNIFFASRHFISAI